MNAPRHTKVVQSTSRRVLQKVWRQDYRPRRVRTAAADDCRTFRRRLWEDHLVAKKVAAQAAMQKTEEQRRCWSWLLCSSHPLFRVAATRTGEERDDWPCAKHRFRAVHASCVVCCLPGRRAFMGISLDRPPLPGVLIVSQSCPSGEAAGADTPYYYGRWRAAVCVFRHTLSPGIGPYHHPRTGFP